MKGKEKKRGGSSEKRKIVWGKVILCDSNEYIKQSIPLIQQEKKYTAIISYEDS